MRHLSVLSIAALIAGTVTASAAEGDRIVIYVQPNGNYDLLQHERVGGGDEGCMNFAATASALRKRDLTMTCLNDDAKPLFVVSCKHFHNGPIKAISPIAGIRCTRSAVPETIDLIDAR